MIAVAVAAAYFAFAVIRFLWRPRHFTWPEPGALGLGSIWWVLLILYLAITWSISGRSFGKRVVGLRLVNVRGDRLGLPTAFLRALFCAAFPVGLFWCAVSRENRSVADLVVRTSVVYDWQLRITPSGSGAASSP